MVSNLTLSGKPETELFGKHPTIATLAEMRSSTVELNYLTYLTDLIWYFRS